MPVIIGKIERIIFSSDDYHVFSVKTANNEFSICIAREKSAPKKLKTVEYSFFGDWFKHKKFGKQFAVDKIEKFKGSKLKKKSKYCSIMKSDDSE